MRDQGVFDNWRTFIDTIQIVNIDDLDFRHLVLLDALLKRHSVSAAARELDLPQPTASHGLARLRKALGDPLLVRARDGMEPTPRAEAIAGVVQQLLELRRDLAEGGQTFSPDRLKREFIIAGSDIAHLVVLTALHSAARFEAPHTSYRALTLSGDEMVSALETGHVDIAVGAYPSLVAGIKTQRLYQEEYLCFGKEGHPFIKSGETDDFMAADHIVVSTKGMAHAHRAVERALLDKIHPDRIRIVASSFLVALAACFESDLILTAPARVIGRLAEVYGLRAVRPPILMEAFEVRQYWHARNQDDPPHRWLR
ncbi:transcriptional regulator, partial [Sphingobium sp. HDIP04]